MMAQEHIHKLAGRELDRLPHPQPGKAKRRRRT